MALLTQDVADDVVALVRKMLNDAVKNRQDVTAIVHLGVMDVPTKGDWQERKHNGSFTISIEGKAK